MIPDVKPRERCPRCGRHLIKSRFDASFRGLGMVRPEDDQRVFGIPAGLCEDCSQLYIDPEILELADLEHKRCVFAIESDSVLLDLAWSLT
jgi:hypothetical protein